MSHSLVYPSSNPLNIFCQNQTRNKRKTTYNAWIYSYLTRKFMIKKENLFSMSLSSRKNTYKTYIRFNVYDYHHSIMTGHAKEMKNRFFMWRWNFFSCGKLIFLLWKLRRSFIWVLQRFIENVEVLMPRIENEWKLKVSLVWLYKLTSNFQKEKNFKLTIFKLIQPPFPSSI